MVLQYGYRCVSPGLTLREYRDLGACSPNRITTYSYLTSEPSYLRRPLQPYDKAPPSPHFHRPPCEYRSVLRPYYFTCLKLEESENIQCVSDR